MAQIAAINKNTNALNLLENLHIPEALIQNWRLLKPLLPRVLFPLLKGDLNGIEKIITDSSFHALITRGGVGTLFGTIRALNEYRRFNLGIATQTQLEHFIHSLDIAENTPGLFAKFPALIRLRCASYITPLILLRKRKGLHHKAPIDPEGKRIIKIIRTAMACPSISEEELHAYYVLTKGAFKADNRVIADALLVKWQELYPESVVLPRVQAERELEKGAYAESKRILGSFLRVHPDAKEAKKLLKRLLLIKK
jgi:hypothetical protein